ncbi:MAG: hypothetical protein FJZ43_05025 [Candidatus Staskawiczbacteria bacterium]|nr:hypothetical protein [Candidatus Staskawiczbacteria bacterium]
MAVKKEKTFHKKLSIYLIISGILILGIYSTYLFFSQSEDVLTAPRSVSRKPFCSTPTSIFQHQGINGFSVFGRTLVFSRPNNNQLEFYDAGPDELFGTADDVGIAPPITFPVNSIIGAPKISGSNIIFSNYNLAAGQRSLSIYSIGPDEIVGTADDVGPSTIFTFPTGQGIPEWNIDGELVTFISTNINPFNPSNIFYQCNAYSTCWTSSPQQVVQTVTLMDAVYSFKGITPPSTGLNTYLWISRNLIPSGANRYNAYYLDQITAQQGLLWNRPLNLNQAISDVSFPYVLLNEENPVVFGTGRIFIGTPYVSSPTQISPNTIPGITLFSDLGGTIGKRPSANGDQLIVWMRNSLISSNFVWSLVVSSYPAHIGKEITLLSGTGTPPGQFFMSVDKDSVTYSYGNNIYSSQCYFY